MQDLVMKNFNKTKGHKAKTKMFRRNCLRISLTFICKQQTGPLVIMEGFANFRATKMTVTLCQGLSKELT